MHFPHLGETGLKKLPVAVSSARKLSVKDAICLYLESALLSCRMEFRCYLFKHSGFEGLIFQSQLKISISISQSIHFPMFWFSKEGKMYQTGLESSADSYRFRIYKQLKSLKSLVLFTIFLFCSKMWLLWFQEQKGRLLETAQKAS